MMSPLRNSRTVTSSNSAAALTALTSRRYSEVRNLQLRRYNFGLRLTSAAMAALLVFLLNLVASLFKPKSQLEAENTALRQQLIVLQRKVRVHANS